MVTRWHYGAMLGAFARTRKRAVFQQAKGRKKRERARLKKAANAGKHFGGGKQQTKKAGKAQCGGSRWLLPTEAVGAVEC